MRVSDGIDVDRKSPRTIRDVLRLGIIKKRGSASTVKVRRMSGVGIAASVANVALLACALPPISLRNSKSAITTACAIEAEANVMSVFRLPALPILLLGLAANIKPEDVNVAALVVWATEFALNRACAVRLANATAVAVALEAKLIKLLVKLAFVEASPLASTAKRIEVVNAPAAVETPAIAEPNKTVMFSAALADATASGVAARLMAVVSEAPAVETPACAEPKNAPVERSALIDAVAAEAAVSRTNVVRAPLDAAVAAGVAASTI